MTQNFSDDPAERRSRDGQPREEGLGRRIAVRAARQGDQRFGRGPRAQSPPRGGVRQIGAERRGTGESGFAAEPQAIERGRIDRAGDRHAAFDERDVDGELAVAGDEFAGPVERIDQDEALGDLDRLARRRRLLGDDRDRRRQPSQTLADDRLGPLVGGGHRTAVPLGARLGAAPIFLHHRRPGRERDSQRRIARPRLAIRACKIEPPRHRLEFIDDPHFRVSVNSSRSRGAPANPIRSRATAHVIRRADGG